MRFKLPKLYPITDAKISGLSHTEQVRRLLDGGASLIQLREKDETAADFPREAQEILKTAHRQGAKIIINDRLEIAKNIKADGVHLGQTDISPIQARSFLGDDFIIGFSTHNLGQALEAVRMPIDYLAFGPIFPTSTKLNPDPVVGLENLGRIRQAIGDFPLVAIGGITLQNAAQVFSAGADCVAVISDLLRQPNKIAEQTGKFNYCQ